MVSSGYTTAFGKKRKRILARKGQCQQCGFTQSLSVHHKDGDKKNNHNSNLVVLCKRCHQQEHGQIMGSRLPFKENAERKRRRNREKWGPVLSWNKGNEGKQIFVDNRFNIILYWACFLLWMGSGRITLALLDGALQVGAAPQAF